MLFWKIDPYCFKYDFVHVKNAYKLYSQDIRAGQKIMRHILASSPQLNPYHIF